MPRPGTSRNTPLSDYVRTYRERESLSHNRLAGLCRDPESGQRLLVQWIINLINGHLTDKAPEMWRLRALAAGMAAGETSTAAPGRRYREHLDMVKRLAAIQWLDLGDVLDVTTSDGSVVTVSVPPTLSDAARTKVIEWAEQMARDLSEMD